MHPPLLTGPFVLPIALDLAATFLFAITGALAAIRKRYDLVGMLVLAFVTGVGGALLRDGLFLQAGPPAVITDGRYLLAVLGGAGVAAYFARHLHRLRLLFVLADALALGMYGIIGAQKSVAMQLPLLTAGLVGVVNAVGGSLLRDVLVREEPLMFKPGEFYALAALAGCVTYLELSVPLQVAPAAAAPAGIAVAFAARMLSVRLGWKTGALLDEDQQSV